MTTEYRRLSADDFLERHLEASEALGDEGLSDFPKYGEVNSPTGWAPCIMNAQGTPSQYWVQGRGWMRTPAGEHYKEVV